MMLATYLGPSDPFKCSSHGSWPAVAPYLAYCAPATGLAFPLTIPVVLASNSLCDWDVLPPHCHRAHAFVSLKSQLLKCHLLRVISFIYTITWIYFLNWLNFLHSTHHYMMFPEDRVLSNALSTKHGSWQMLHQYLVDDLMSTCLNWRSFLFSSPEPSFPFLHKAHCPHVPPSILPVLPFAMQWIILNVWFVSVCGSLTFSCISSKIFFKQSLRFL